MKKQQRPKIPSYKNLDKIIYTQGAKNFYFNHLVEDKSSLVFERAGV